MRIDETLKNQAEEILEEIGLNMTAFFTSSLKALVREKKVPFKLTTIQKSNADYLAKLDTAIEEAKNGQAYQFFGEGSFSDTPQRIDV
jgi:addiction module RelB/DinJ family antitoxin